MKKNIFVLILLVLLTLSNKLIANDLVIFKDGTVKFCEILSYDKDNNIKIQQLDGTTVDYQSSSVLTSRTNIDVDNIISQTISPTYNMITYFPRNKEFSYEIPPRFKYQGQTYKMESKWGMETQILEFFDMLKLNTIDYKTENLIIELKVAMEKQNKIFKTIGITQLTGLSLIMVPFFFMDDSTTPSILPTWATWAGIAGLTIDIASIGMLISQINTNQDHYLKDIAESFNKNLYKK